MPGTVLGAMGSNALRSGSLAHRDKSSPEMERRALPLQGTGALLVAPPGRSRNGQEPEGLEEGAPYPSLGCLWDLQCGEAMSSLGGSECSWLRGSRPGAGQRLAAAVHHGGNSSSRFW